MVTQRSFTSIDGQLIVHENEIFLFKKKDKYDESDIIAYQTEHDFIITNYVPNIPNESIYGLIEASSMEIDVVNIPMIDKNCEFLKFFGKKELKEITIEIFPAVNNHESLLHECIKIEENKVIITSASFGENI